MPEAVSLGMEVWRPEEGHWRFFDRRRQLDIEVGAESVRVNGIKIHLDRPMREDGDGPLVAEADWRSTLEPILTKPEVAGEADLIWIDAGHGGKDPGAVNRNAGLVEKDLALEISLELARILSKAGLRVGLTREDDSFVELGKRTGMSNAAGADLFLSVHWNSFEDSSVKGVEVFVLAPEGLASTGAARESESDDVRMTAALPGNRFDAANAVLGYRLQRSLVTETGDVDRGLKRARFAVLKGLDCPGALVELGFLSERGTAARIAESETRRQMAKALAAGIFEYLEIVRDGRVEVPLRVVGEEGGEQP